MPAVRERSEDGNQRGPAQSGGNLAFDLERREEENNKPLSEWMEPSPSTRGLVVRGMNDDSLLKFPLCASQVLLVLTPIKSKVMLPVSNKICLFFFDRWMLIHETDLMSLINP